MAEPFQLNDQHWRRSHDFHAFEMNLRLFALLTSGLVLQLLGLVKLLETLVECGVVDRLGVVHSLLLG